MVWGWTRLISRYLSEEAKSEFPHLQRLIKEITARPAGQRALALSQEYALKTEMDSESHRNMFPGNPPMVNQRENPDNGNLSTIHVEIIE